MNLDLLPEGFAIFRCDRQKGRGGGVAIIFQNQLNFSQDDFSAPLEECEALLICFQVNPTFSLSIVVVYRPPGPHLEFNSRLMEVLSTALAAGNAQLILGDVNRWIEDPSDPPGSRSCGRTKPARL